MFDPGGVLHASRGERSFNEFGMISLPQSPRVHSRSRAEGALGDLGGRKEKATHHLCNGDLFVPTCKHQSAG